MSCIANEKYDSGGNDGGARDSMFSCGQSLHTNAAVRWNYLSPWSAAVLNCYTDTDTQGTWGAATLGGPDPQVLKQ